MVGGLCRLWAVMPILCGGWSWFMGQLWLFVGSHTHFMSWWVVIVGRCAPCHSWILTGGSCGCSWVVVPVQCHGGQFVGGWCSLSWVLKLCVTQPH